MPAPEPRCPAETPPVKSGVAGIEWPPMPGAGGASLMALLAQFEDSERWPRELLRKVQFHQLTHLVNFARTTAPFWLARLDAAGYEPESPLDEHIWAEIPILTRAALRDAGKTVHSTSPPAAHGRIGSIEVALAADSAVKIYRTQLAARIADAFAVRYHLWFGHDFTAKRAMILGTGDPRAAYPAGRQMPVWDRTIEPLFETGPAAALNADTPVRDQLEWLCRVQPAYLLTTPANLARLIEAANEPGGAFDGLRAVETYRGALSPGLRAAVREAWGVPVHDRFATEETGWIALQCPDAEHYHAAAESALVEILDGDGRACAPGETGRVVVTPLHNFATPLIRYDTGGRAEMGGLDCVCGRTLPVIERFI